MSQNKPNHLSRRSFLQRSAVAAAGGLAMAAGARFSTPYIAHARAADVSGSKMTVLWMKGSIAAAADLEQKMMEDWAKAAGVELTIDTVALAEWAAKLATLLVNSARLKPSACGCNQLIRTSTLRRCLRFRFVILIPSICLFTPEEPAC